MRRLVLLLPVLAVLLGGSVFTGIATAAPSKNYTVTRTFGPYNGAAKIGQPGSVPDGRALAVYCGNRESVIGGTAKISRKTSYGTARSDVLTLDVIGAFYDTDRSDVSLGWGAFANATGKPGWNSVTITVTCRRQ
ncbi:hypothetical protein [Pseudonocardia charpentierae]|uniref:Secreted protein n=1 Tax=Pseudonocardia charpentierae TaxID=3075545 RepID=A0ABU2NFD1_9PSEU|nr:hypothetical protein [Pseudonocardia sp. DSM 45834]MDT0352667.1 hypothetical protein [Pseudonocardia sp. DSM 45834]